MAGPELLPRSDGSAAQDPPESEGRPKPRRFPRPTRQQLALPALVGLLLAASPLTGGTRIVPKLVLGVLGGGALLIARMRRATPAGADSSGPTLARPTPAAAGVLVVTAILFAPTLHWLFEAYTDTVWTNGHGLFVPLVMILLVRSALRRDPVTAEESSAWGFALLIPALVLAVADAGIGSRYVALLGLLLALPGLSLLLLGARRTKSISVPLALGIFLVPLPTQLEDVIGLRVATSAVAASVLDWLGAPVAWQQSNVRLPRGGLSISHNCSGFSALTASVAFAVLLAATARSRVRAALLVLGVYPLVVLVNGLRVVVIVYLTLHLGGEYLNTPIHGLSGIAVFAGTLVILWLCADRDSFRRAVS